MNKLLSLLALLGFALSLQAAEDAGAAAQRARIASERNQADAVYRAQEKACYGKFAVNDCLNAARSKRREALADLRRQEISLDDEERRRRAAERLRSIEERNSAEAQGLEAQQRAKPAQQDRDARASDKSAGRAAAERASPGKAAQRQQEIQRRQAEKEAQRNRQSVESEKNRKRQQERLAEAAERKAKQQKRLAERTKPAAQPLPAQP